MLYSTQSDTGPSGRRVLAIVSPATLQRRLLPLANAHEACLDASGKLLFFTRMGLQVTGDNVRKYRDGSDNLWSSTGDGGDPRQHTRHQGWDVRLPSLGDGRIVYQLGADLRVLELASGADRALDIQLTSDFDQQRERVLHRPTEFLEGVRFAPAGERLVIIARGQAAEADLPRPSGGAHR